MIRFSVVIPTYNRAPWLAGALESVLEQTEQPYEVIVVDDGSTDDTWATLVRYQDRVKSFRQSNAGPALARNRGIDAATGDYVAFLDSDDFWFPWTLALYREAIEKYDNPAMVEGTHVEFETSLNTANPSPSEADAVTFQHAKDYLASPRITLWPSGTAVRTETLKAVGGFTKHAFNAEDSDLWLRLGIEKGFVHIAKPPVFAYRRHQSNAVASLANSVKGILQMIDCEQRCGYPGGSARRRDRLRILTTHTRPLSVACAQCGLPKEAMEIYLRTFSWNLRLARVRYLLALPWLARRS